MWVLLLECLQGGGAVDDTAEPRDTGGVFPVEEGCGDFWGVDALGRHWRYDFVPDEWIEGWNEYDVVREDVWNGQPAWVVYNEGKRDTGSARHRWKKERWYVCDSVGIWLVHGTTTWSTWRGFEREDYVYTDAMAEPGFLYPASVREGDSWDSTGAIDHIDDATGALISTTSLEAWNEVVGTESVHVPSGTFDALILSSGQPGSSTSTTSWLVPGIGLLADDTWELSHYRE